MSNCIRNYKFRLLQVSIFSFYVAVCIDCKMFVSREIFIQRDMINVYLYLHISFLALNVLHEIEFYFVSLKFLY